MLSDLALKRLTPRPKAYSVADSRGLFIEVMPGGAKVWRLRYRLQDRQEKVTLGEYPTYSLAEARVWRDDCRGLFKRGVSPMALKRGDETPPGVPAATKEMAELFCTNWCRKTLERARVKRQMVQAADTVEVFAWFWFNEIVTKVVADPKNIKRVLIKDVIPCLGSKQLGEIKPSDILAITDRIKARGADQMALQTRNIIKRMFAFAIERERAEQNPAAAISAKRIAGTKSRDVALKSEEIAVMLRTLYRSNAKRQQKLALHLLMICMIRKTELTDAKWSELNLEIGEWSIPATRMKNKKEHLILLPRQAIEMFRELKQLAYGSDYVFPSPRDSGKSICHTSLNAAIRSIEFDLRDFTIHDFRRTASTLLNERGHNRDWVEKALSHVTGGVRGIYNRAEYADQRREMLQAWADYLDDLIDDGRKVIVGRFPRSSEVA